MDSLNSHWMIHVMGRRFSPVQTDTLSEVVSPIHWSLSSRYLHCESLPHAIRQMGLNYYWAIKSDVFR